MGPGVTLSGLAARQLGDTPHEALPTFADRKESDATSFARKALGRAWAKGLSLPLPESTQRRLALSPTSFSEETFEKPQPCLLYTSPSPRDRQKSRMPSSA